MQGFLLVTLFVLAFAWLVLLIRRNKAESNARPAAKVANEKSAFHAVSIDCGENSCLAAKQLTGRRFLASAAPHLPLPECNVEECRCNFTHHADRRSSQDRRTPFGSTGYVGNTGSYERERRNRVERRKNKDAGEN